MNKQPHLGVDSSQVAKRVIVCGDPARVTRAGLLLDGAEVIAENREYRLINGYYQGQKITLCSTGIGAPSAVIALEELNNCGAKYVIRVGSAGALQPHIALGDLLVVEAAVRDEGTSKAYIASEYPAAADIDIVFGLRQALVAAKQPFHRGVIRTNDSFYTDEEPQICQHWHKKGVLGADNETAALLTVGRLRGVRVGAVLNTVVQFEQDAQQGIAAYANAEQRMMQAEQQALTAALMTLCQQA